MTTISPGSPAARRFFGSPVLRISTLVPGSGRPTEVRGSVGVAGMRVAAGDSSVAAVDLPDLGAAEGLEGVHRGRWERRAAADDPLHAAPVVGGHGAGEEERGEHRGHAAEEGGTTLAEQGEPFVRSEARDDEELGGEGDRQGHRATLIPVMCEKGSGMRMRSRPSSRKGNQTRI